MGVIRRLPLDAAAAVLLPVTVVLFAFGSASVDELVRIGSKGRWLALIVLAGVAAARVLALRPNLRAAVLRVWVPAAALVVLGTESALWSVDARLTLGRTFTVGVLFVAAAALALGSPDASVAATRVLGGVLAGIAIVALTSLIVLAVAHDDAVLAATAGAGWRFRGVGQNPNTVAMLLSIGLPLAVWRALEPRRRAQAQGVALVLLFAGEIAFSGSRGALVAGFGGAIATALALAPSPGRKLALAAALALLAFGCVPLAGIPDKAAPAPAAAGGVAPPKTRGFDAESIFRLQDELGFPLEGAYRPPVPRTFLGSSGRAQAWDGALRQGARRPVAGYGFGTEDKVFVDRFYAFEGGFVENTYIGLFLQLGAVGVALFLALLAGLAWSAAQLLRRPPPGTTGPAAAATGVLVAAILIGGTQTGLLSVGNIAAPGLWMCLFTLPVLARQAAT